MTKPIPDANFKKAQKQSKPNPASRGPLVCDRANLLHWLKDQLVLVASIPDCKRAEKALKNEERVYLTEHGRIVSFIFLEDEGQPIEINLRKHSIVLGTTLS